MLNEIAETIKKIEAGIQHKNKVIVRVNDLGLIIVSQITCTKNRRDYFFERIFSYEEMRNIVNDEILIGAFIDIANNEFRKPYSDT